MSSTEDGAAAPAEDVTAGSSAAEGEKGSVFDAVKASLNPTEESPASDETGKETAEAEPEGEADGGEEQDALTDAEKKLLSPRAQERFRGLASRAKAAETRVSDLTPKAEGFDRIVAFNRKHGISDSDFNNALELLAITKTDKNRAFEVFSGILENLARSTGRALSPEIQERIRLGHISEEDARKLSRAEADAKLTKEQRDAEQEAARQAEAERAWGERVQTATTAVDEWAKSKAGSDPDWSKKMPHYQRALAVELQSGGFEKYPKSAQEAVALVEKVVKQVDADLKPFRQQKPAIKPDDRDGSSPRATAEPQSMAEAIKIGLAKRG